MAVVGSKLALLALLCAACTNIAAGERTFDGTGWHVTAIDSQATPPGENYHVDFRKGQLGGRFGCNSFSGAYHVQRDAILIVGPVGATEMACEGPAMDFENRGFRVLQQAMRIDWTSRERLKLSNSAGSIELERVP